MRPTFARPRPLRSATSLGVSQRCLRPCSRYSSTSHMARWETVRRCAARTPPRIGARRGSSSSPSPAPAADTGHVHASQPHLAFRGRSLPQTAKDRRRRSPRAARAVPPPPGPPGERATLAERSRGNSQSVNGKQVEHHVRQRDRRIPMEHASAEPVEIRMTGRIPHNQLAIELNVLRQRLPELRQPVRHRPAPAAASAERTMGADRAPKPVQLRLEHPAAATRKRTSASKHRLWQPHYHRGRPTLHTRPMRCEECHVTATGHAIGWLAYRVDDRVVFYCRGCGEREFGIHRAWRRRRARRSRS
jgi:hypothetical protein